MINLVSALYSEPWAILGTHHQTLAQQISSQLSGGFTRQDRGDAIPGVRIESGIAFLMVNGIIGKHLEWGELLFGGGVDGSLIETQYIELAGRRDIHTIVALINSPGGRAVGLTDLAQVIREVGETKRTIAFIDNMGASAGYGLAAAHREIYGASTAVIGSIGVYSAMEDVSRRWELEGRTLELFRSSPGKGRGIAGAPFSDADRAFFLNRVSELGGRFDSMVRDYRPTIAAQCFNGDPMSGDLAFAAGMIDGVFPSLPHLIGGLSLAA